MGKIGDLGDRGVTRFAKLNPVIAKHHEKGVVHRWVKMGISRHVLDGFSIKLEGLPFAKVGRI